MPRRHPLSPTIFASTTPATAPTWSARSGRGPGSGARTATRTAWATALLAVLVVTGTQSASADSAAKPPSAGSPARQAWIQVAGPSALPVDVAAAAWSRPRSNTSVSMGACAGAHCINVELVDVSSCDSDAAIASAIGGCAVPGPDGSCTAQVKSWLLAYPDALRAALEHEVGHCLGLPHNTSDKRSIMSPNLSLMSPPAGPDNTDLGNLRDVTW